MDKMNDIQKQIIVREIGAFSVDLAKARKDIRMINSLSKGVLLKISEAVSNDKSICCKSGCSYCCNIRVSVFAYELVSIYYYLMNKLDNESRNKVIANIERAYKEVEHITLDQQLISNIKCPFLSDKNTCLIYSVRPMTCAKYCSNSIKVCLQTYEEVDNLSISHVLNASAEYFYSIRFESMNMCEKDMNEYELIRAIYNLCQNPILINRWRNKHVLFEDDSMVISNVRNH